MQYVKAKFAREKFGVTNDTLRKWADTGMLRTIRGPGGHRLYNLESLARENEQHTKEDSQSGRKIIYCRVSSYKQKDDLERQIAYLQEKYPKHEVVKDVASGINFKRKNLQKILDEAIKGDISEIVVAHRDRMCRIAWDHFEWLFTRLGVNIIVDDTEKYNPESELTDDLFSIIHVFSSRHYGQRRKYTTKGIRECKDKNPSEAGEHEECESEQENED